jgi:hypothetical protein
MGTRPKENGPMNKKELAALLRTFVAGTSGKWDWDDFISVPQRDPEIEAIRQRLLTIDQQYPPTKPGEYCNEHGAEAMLRIADALLDGP